MLIAVARAEAALKGRLVLQSKTVCLDHVWPPSALRHRAVTVCAMAWKRILIAVARLVVHHVSRSRHVRSLPTAYKVFAPVVCAGCHPVVTAFKTVRRAVSTAAVAAHASVVSVLAVLGQATVQAASAPAQSALHQRVAMA